MVSKTLRSAAEAQGFTYAEPSTAGKDYLYGVYGGYLVTLSDAGNRKTVFINYLLPLAEDEDESVRLLEISESLKAVITGKSVCDYTVEADGISCTTTDSLDSFLALLDDLISLLNEKGLIGVSQCSCCGNKIGKRLPKKLTRGQKNYLLCEHCALDQLEDSAKQTTSPAETLPKKTGLGILGGMIGGICGLLIYVVLYYFLSANFADSDFEIRYLFSLFGFASAFLVYRGFTLFSKRPCISAHVSISIITLVSVALSQYAGSFVGYAQLQGFSLAQAAKLPSMWLIHLRTTLDSSITYEQSVLSLYRVAPLFYKLLGFSLLFALIGTIIFQLGLFEKGKATAEPAKIETLRITPAGSEPEHS